MKDRTLGAVLRHQSARQPDKPFLLFEGGSTSYAEADRLAASACWAPWLCR